VLLSGGSGGICSLLYIKNRRAIVRLTYGVHLVMANTRKRSEAFVSKDQLREENASLQARLEALEAMVSQKASVPSAPSVASVPLRVDGPSLVSTPSVPSVGKAPGTGTQVILVNQSDIAKKNRVPATSWEAAIRKVNAKDVGEIESVNFIIGETGQTAAEACEKPAFPTPELKALIHSINTRKGRNWIGSSKHWYMEKVAFTDVFLSKANALCPQEHFEVS